LSSSRYAWTPKKEPGHFPSKGTVVRVHPGCLGDLFGELHYPRLNPEDLVETVSNLAEVMVHGLLLNEQQQWAEPLVRRFLSRLLFRVAARRYSLFDL